MRVIEVEEESGDGRKLALWIVGGAVVGVAAGVLIAERYSGRRASPRSLWRRVRSLARTAAAQWGPMVDLAFELRDVWVEARSEERGEEEEYEGEGLEDDFDEDLDEDLDDEDLDSDEWEGEEEEDEDEGEGEGEDEVAEEIASRVVEAFVNDPVLADRDIEIEPGDEGTVILHGRVRAAKEVAHAVTIARGVPGVTGVRQRLEVRRRD